MATLKFRTATANLLRRLMMSSRAHINTQKIKGIISVNIHKGEQVCADKINQ